MTISSTRRLRPDRSVALHEAWEPHLAPLAALRLQRAVASARHPVHLVDRRLPQWLKSVKSQAGVLVALQLGFNPVLLALFTDSSYAICAQQRWDGSALANGEARDENTAR